MPHPTDVAGEASSTYKNSKTTREDYDSQSSNFTDKFGKTLITMNLTTKRLFWGTDLCSSALSAHSADYLM